MRVPAKLLLLSSLFLVPPARGIENVFILSDTVSHFERVFGVRSRVTAWFGSGNGSTIKFAFPGKADVSFRLAEPAEGARYIDHVQVEPLGPFLTSEQASAYARFLVDDLARRGNAACRPVREDQDGMNAFIVHACSDKANPAAPPVQVTTTVQSIGERSVLFVEIAPKK